MPMLNQLLYWEWGVGGGSNLKVKIQKKILDPEKNIIFPLPVPLLD